jgi:uncharacterized repeat protein (TIGR03943 family)
LNALPQMGIAQSTRSAQQATELRSPTLLDWVLSFGEPPNPDAFVGETADLTGFVYQRENLPPDTWLVSRFVVTCCVADATAIGIMVRAPGTIVENDTWVHIQGHFVAENVGGKQLPVLIADTVEFIDPPAQPYLYYR